MTIRGPAAGLLIDVDGQYEAKDAEGGWWPVTLLDVNGDGTYAAHHWPVVHLANIRV
eukprot:gene38352-16815_t